MNIDLIIFDLDGTLVDSIPDLSDSLNYAAKKLGYPLIAEKEVPALVGNGVRALISKAFELTIGTPDFEKAQEAFMEYYSQNLTTRTVFFPNVEDTIFHFSQKKLAILSNKPDHFTKPIIEALGLQKHFEIVLGANKHMERKPSAEPIQYIMNKLGVLPEKTLMVGDGDADVMAGKNAGVNTCAVSYGYRSAAELELLQPDFLLDDIGQIRSLIQ